MTAADTPNVDTVDSMGFDYKATKDQFLSLIDKWLNNQRPFKRRLYEFHSKKYIDKMIKQILDYDAKASTKHEVVKKDGKYILVLKKRYSFDPCIQVLSWEDMFDLFMPMHIRSGHKGKEYLMNEVGGKYKYPSMCLPIFKRICNICNRAEGRYSLIATTRVGLVYVINMVMMRCDERFRYILIYADRETNFVILRPLMAKTDLEISTELFRIFAQFGPPRRLVLHGYNSALTDKVSNNIKGICPEFNIEIEHRSVSYDLPTIVTDRIQEWMNINNSSIWEIGCCVVQAQMNKDPKMKPKVFTDQLATPHSLFFNTQAGLTLNNTNNTEQKKMTAKRINVFRDADTEYTTLEEIKKSKIQQSHSFQTQTSLYNSIELEDSNSRELNNIIIDEDSHGMYNSESEIDEGSHSTINNDTEIDEVSQDTIHSATKMDEESGVKIQSLIKIDEEHKCTIGIVPELDEESQDTYYESVTLTKIDEEVWDTTEYLNKTDEEGWDKNYKLTKINEESQESVHSIELIELTDTTKNTKGDTENMENTKNVQFIELENDKIVKGIDQEYVISVVHEEEDGNDVNEEIIVGF